jgi:uncharacterized protein YdeI (YjbR/CyaY-like superfamily)
VEANDESDPPIFFATADDLRAWFAKNHDRCTELWVGYYRKDSCRPSITWPESVDEALCFGWIDGIRQKIDDQSYKVPLPGVDRRARGARSTSGGLRC